MGVLLDSNGDELVAETVEKSKNALSRAQAEAVLRTFSSYISNVFQVGVDPILRASDPFVNHAWVFAAIMAKAINVSQVPFLVYREDSPSFKPRAGLARRSVQRYLAQRSRRSGHAVKDLRPVFDHPVNDLFARPNPYQTQSDMWQSVIIWMELRGQVMLVLTGEDGATLAPGSTASHVWPMSPDLFTPIMDVKTNSLKVWRVRIPRGFTGKTEGSYAYFLPHEVVHVKYVNPSEYIDGFSRVTPAAQQITMDSLAVAHNAAVLRNGGDPGGVLTNEGGFSTEDEERSFLEKWKERHEGANKRNRTAILTGGWKYFAVGLTPQEMGYKELMETGRDAVLATIGTPKTILGVTESVPYAVQLGQDKNFWDKSLLPVVRIIEDAIDVGLMSTYPDNEVAAFDLSTVDALRQGQAEKISLASQLSGAALHVPPRVAYEVVGLDVPRYEGDDVCVVQGFATPLADALDPIASPSPPTSSPSDSAPDAPDPAGVPATPESSPPAPGATPDVTASARAKRIAKARARWVDIVKRVHAPTEKSLSAAWTKWIRGDKKLQLARFDQIGRAHV